MKHLWPIPVTVLLYLGATACGAPDPPKGGAANHPPGGTLRGPATYATLKPFFTQTCTRCHGGKKQKAGGIDLNSYAGIMKGGPQGPIVVPGDPTGSTLLGNLWGTRNPRMPADKGPMPVGDIQVITEWIKNGAKER